MMIGAAAVAVGAYADQWTDPATGITWTYTINDAAAKTITLGGGTISTPAMSTATVLDAAEIPWTMKIGEDIYTVSALAFCAFYNCSGLNGTLSIPSTVSDIDGYAFYGTGISGISSFGSQSTRIITTGTSGGQSVFRNCGNLSGTVEIPDSYTGVLPNYTFAYNGSMAGLVIGIGTMRTGRYLAHEDASLIGAWFKGKATVNFGTQDYTEVGVLSTFQNCTSLKVVLLGKNTKQFETGTFCNNSTGCKVFVPANGMWDNLNLGGTDNVKIPYGAGKDLDLLIDENAGTITATPTIEDRLVQVLEAAPVFKAQFGLNTRINVTNTIEMTSGSITSEMLNAVEFNTLLLTFKVNTKAALESVLVAVPESPHLFLAIDASDAKEELTLPQGREIYVRVSAEGRQGKYTPKVNGLLITFH